MSENTSCETKKENANRPFDLSFAFRHKSDPNNPALSINLHGEFAKKIVIALSIVGVVASLFTLFKLYKFIKSFF